MININQLNIDVTATNIVVDVATTSGYIFTSLKVWTSSTYPDPAQAIDLSALYAGTSEFEAFNISASDLGLTSLNGLFFIEFMTNEPIPDDACCPDINVRLATVSNLIKYHKCVLDNLIALEVDDCGVKGAGYEECGDCDGNTATDAQLFLDGLYLAIQQGFYEEALEIIKKLDKLCKVCTSCPDYGETKVLAGGGFGIYNNNLTLL